MKIIFPLRRSRNSGRKAASGLEYGILVALIMLVIIGGVAATGRGLSNIFGGMAVTENSGAAGIGVSAQPIPGVTGVDGIPTWVTTACQIPTVSQIAALPLNTPIAGVTLGCIPAGSTLTEVNNGNGDQQGYYAQPPGSSTKYLYMITCTQADCAGTNELVQTYSGMYDAAGFQNNPGFCIDSNSTGYGYLNIYGGTSLSADRTTCHSSGISGGGPYSGAGQPSLIGAANESASYGEGSYGITAPAP